MKALHTVAETNMLIRSGKSLLLAGDESLLAQLEKGNWIGGTIPYFMGDDGGTVRFDVLQVTQLPTEAKIEDIRNYSVAQIAQLPNDYPNHGFSQIILPGFSEIHRIFAEEGWTWPGLFSRPLMGWVSGHHLEKPTVPKVINGRTGLFSSEDAVVIHFSLPPTRFARVSIINLFEEGAGDIITFKQRGFRVEGCYINGQPANFAEYLSNRAFDARIPLVADFVGAKLNSCVRSVDLESKSVTLFAPVFEGVEYRFAKPVSDYEATFAERVSLSAPDPVFMCNCVLNYAYAKLENKKTGKMTGPMTFGEIAYMLLNQTVVYMTIENVT